MTNVTRTALVAAATLSIVGVTAGVGALVLDQAHGANGPTIPTFKGGTPGPIDATIVISPNQAVDIGCGTVPVTYSQPTPDLIVSCGSTTTIPTTTTTLPGTTTTTIPVTTTTTLPTTTTTTVGGYVPAPPSGITSCAALNQSPACAWPGPSNTGVPAGTALTKMTAANIPHPAGCNANSLSGGQLTIGCNGTVIDAMDIEEINVFVSAANVIFTRDLIQTHSYGQKDQNVILVDYGKSSAHLALYDSTVNGYGYQGQNYHVLAYGQYLAVRDNLENGTDAVVYDNGGTLIEDSWLHGVNSCEAYMNPSGPNSQCSIHADVVQKSEGSNDALIHNTLQTTTNDITSGLQCCDDQGPVSNWKVEGNLFETGGFQLYGGVPGQHPQSTTTYSGNHFTLGQNGEKGYQTYAYAPGIITWSGNVDDNTGTIVSN